MSAKDSQIFVGNLDLSTSRNTLQKYFSKYGYVKTLIVPWNAEKKCIRGFAFVHYEDSEAVDAALAETQTHMIDGVKVQVRRKNVKLNQGKSKINQDKSKPNQDKSKSKHDNSVIINQDYSELNQYCSELNQDNSELNVGKSKLYKDKEVGEEEHKIFVVGLSSSSNCTTLRQHFNQFGRVKEVSIPWNNEKHCNKGFGFVQFEDANTLEAALTSYHEIDGVQIKVRNYKRRSPASRASYNSNDDAQTAFAQPHPDRAGTAASVSAIYNGVAPAAVPSTNRQATNDGLNVKKRTVSAYQLDGDVDVPEICVYSITSSCKNYISGCRRLHAKCSMHWQFHYNDHWYNFKDFQSKGLEEAFLNPDTDGTKIIPIVPTRTPTNKAVIDLQAILGTYSWKADFDKMKISSVFESLDIRRLSTQSSVISRNKLATSYEWYFKDEYGKFIKYGNTSTAGKIEHLPEVTSEDIEIKFVKEKLATFEFNSPSYTYVIDFNEMTQTNKSTLVSRQVRRRPNPLNISDTDTPQNGILPSYWAPVNTKLISEQFALKPSDAEFQKFQNIFTRELPKYSVVKIERNQNSYLWTAYQNKKQYVLKKNGGTNVNEMYLFHGTHTKNVKAICEQNMDWRLHGSNVGHVYGRGSYFSSSAAFSADYCNSDTDEKVIFIVKVIVGTTTRGDSSMTRPPDNYSTSSLYDTTVDDVASPKVFVKYDSQEYYPEYIVTYKPKPVQPAYYSAYYSDAVLKPSTTRLLISSSRSVASAASASVQPISASRIVSGAASSSGQSPSVAHSVASHTTNVTHRKTPSYVNSSNYARGDFDNDWYSQAQVDAAYDAQSRATRPKTSSSEGKGCSVM